MTLGRCSAITIKMMLCYQSLRPILFLLPPEKAHRAAIRALQTGVAPRSRFSHPSLATELAGFALPNPVGLAAGFDKNAECVAGALASGFGFVEIGTVTPRAQPGNPQPRLFRLTEHEAVINRLGFNNEGVNAAATRLAARKAKGMVGGNVGKNKDSTDATADYVAAMRVLYPHVDYITANISSPNTPGLRDLQQAGALRELIIALKQTRDELCAVGEKAKPIFIKIAPDNDDPMLEVIAEVALSEKLDGLIVSNTTLTREGVARHRFAGETGGLSGKPLMAFSTDRLRKTYQLTRGEIPLIGVGGIASAEDAYAKIRAGATAVQLYTALVYQGFGLVEKINRGLAGLLARDGFLHISDAVGADAR